MAQWHKQRAWGYYITFIRTPWFCLKLLRFRPFGRLSMQKHKHRTEVWIFLKGLGMMKIVYDNYIHSIRTRSNRLDVLTVLPNTWHQFIAEDKPVYVLEFQYGRKVTEDDIERK